MANYTYVWDGTDGDTNVDFNNDPVVQSGFVGGGFDASNGVVDTITFDFASNMGSNVTAGAWSTNIAFKFFVESTIYAGDGDYGANPVSDAVHILLPQGWAAPLVTGLGYGSLFSLESPELSGNYAISFRINVDSANVTWSTVCFTPGVEIECADGQMRKVEELKVGDMVLTRDHGLQPLRWVGKTPVTHVVLEQFPDRRPVRIKAGVFGNTSDLVVSPQHRIHVTGALAEALGYDPVEGMLVAAKSLVNGNTITIDPPSEPVDYIHIMFDTHELVNSCGMWTESYRPGEFAMSVMEEATRREVVALFPQLETDPEGFFEPARPLGKVGQVKRIIRKRPELAH